MRAREQLGHVEHRHGRIDARPEAVEEDPDPGLAGTGEGPAAPAAPLGPATSTSTLKIMRAKSVQMPFMRSLKSSKASFL